MKYQIKVPPKQVYYATTHQFTLTDESGKELEIRKWEDTKGGGYYIWNEASNCWDDFNPDEELEDFILNELEY